jgi:hypothetical protein
MNIKERVIVSKDVDVDVDPHTVPRGIHTTILYPK